MQVRYMPSLCVFLSVCLSVCLFVSVCVSVTLRYCIKTSERGNTHASGCCSNEFKGEGGMGPARHGQRRNLPPIEMRICVYLHHEMHVLCLYDTHFTVRRNASAVYAVVVCLCLCFCLSVTLQYCINTAKRGITQIMPHDSPRTLVF